MTDIIMNNIRETMIPSIMYFTLEEISLTVMLLENEIKLTDREFAISNPPKSIKGKDINEKSKCLNSNDKNSTYVRSKTNIKTLLLKVK